MHAPERHELLAGWGQTAPTAADVQRPIVERELLAAFDDAPPRGVLARGLGRSYGDAALNAGGRVIETTELGGINLDAETGVCTASAGVSIDQLIRVLVPRGFFVPVTPGTRYVTVGGAVAADIHGKNHHADGSWFDHVVSLRLLLPSPERQGAGASGEVVEVSPETRPDLFWATAGGMGLTGIVIDCTFRCRRIETSRLVVETIRTRDLDETMDLMRHDPCRYTVAWIDPLARGRAMGRSVLTRGDFARPDELPRSQRRDPLGYEGNILASAPPLMPNVINRATVKAFNELWYRKAPKHREGELQPIAKFFHPLDMVDHWNVVYGSPGFVQWQFALPFDREEVLTAIVEQLSLAAIPSFVNVLKTFGPGNAGPLSFPRQGWTLAIDVPCGTAGLAGTLDRLDELVAEAGGCIYLAKDSRLQPELLAVMYPRLDEWRAVRERVDPHRLLTSDLARRLGL